MKINCSKCSKPTNPFDVGEEGSYYNSKNEIVCWNCFKKELEELEQKDMIQHDIAILDNLNTFDTEYFYPKKMKIKKMTLEKEKKLGDKTRK